MINSEDLRGARLLLENFKISRHVPDLSLLRELLVKFSYLPYENATKIIKVGEDKNLYDNFRFPFEMVVDYGKFGSGGTCFSLVYLFKSLLDECKFDSRLVLADRTYGNDTHSAILVYMDDDIYLADPGYLIFTPIKLSREIAVIHSTGIYNIYIEPEEGGRAFLVYSLFPDGNKKFRYKIKNEAIERDTYLEAWKNSFEFEMMNSLVITKATNEEHLYIRNNFFQHKFSGSKIKKHISTDELIQYTSKAGISEEIIRKALTLLGRL